MLIKVKFGCVYLNKYIVFKNWSVLWRFNSICGVILVIVGIIYFVISFGGVIVCCIIGKVGISCIVCFIWID